MDSKQLSPILPARISSDDVMRDLLRYAATRGIATEVMIAGLAEATGVAFQFLDRDPADRRPLADRIDEFIARVKHAYDRPQIATPPR
jgi:hypothetical protein